MIETAENYLGRNRTRGDLEKDRGFVFHIVDRVSGLGLIRESAQLLREQERTEMKTIIVRIGTDLGPSGSGLHTLIRPDYWKELEQASMDLGKALRDLKFSDSFKESPKQHWKKGFSQKIPKPSADSGDLTEAKRNKIRQKRKKRRKK